MKPKTFGLLVFLRKKYIYSRPLKALNVLKHETKDDSTLNPFDDRAVAFKAARDSFSINFSCAGHLWLAPPQGAFRIACEKVGVDQPHLGQSVYAFAHGLGRKLQTTDNRFPFLHHI